jgi:lipopolysaccharide export LptBFGC system permease protein LptF
LGICLGLVFAIRGHGTTAIRATAFTVAVACSVTTVAVLQWVLPETNQTYRVGYANEAFQVSTKRPLILLRGLGEMSLTELALESRRAAAPHDSNVARRELYGRLTLVTAPVALTGFFLAVVGRIRFQRITGFLLVHAFYVCMAYQREWMMHSPPWMFAIAWAPTLLLAVSSVVALRYRRTVA